MYKRYIAKIESALQRALVNSELITARALFDNHVSVRYAIEYFK